MNKLTETQCKNAKPSVKAYKLFDGAGLYLEITVNGSKLWRQKYYYLNKEKRLALGSYPTISLKQARDRRDAAKRLISENKDPVQERRKEKEGILADNGNTFEKIAREWHDHKKQEWKQPLKTFKVTEHSTGL